jgi:TonB family protein
MRVRRFAISLAALSALIAGMAVAQKPVEPPQAAPIERATDAGVDAVSEYIGRALFLRCFCAENTLSFDAQGKPVGNIKAEDWTLAAVTVTKVERRGPGEIEMEGVRAAIKFVPERREFERHALNDEKVKITIADPGDPKRLEQELEAVFSVGIDVPLQRSVPDYWQHYFDPKLAWPADDLSAQSIYYLPNDPALTPPSVSHKAEAAYTGAAEHDHVKGVVQMRFIVDAQGVARHVMIAQPLGYGLDQRAVEAMAKVRFAPAMRAGKPVPFLITLQQEFVLVSPPR